MSKYAIAALLMFVGPMTLAGEIRDLSVETRIDYGYGPEPGESMQGILQLAPSLRVEFSPQLRLVAEGRIRLDVEDQLEPGRTRTDTYSGLSRPAVIGDLGTAEIRDAYIERSLDSGVMRIGKQQLVWGKLDGLKVLDVLNPQDLREFVLNEFGESRISLWSAYLDVTLGSWRTELAVIPDNTGHAIPAPGAWFELTAPRYRYGAAVGDPTPRIATHRHSIGSATSAYALRLSRQFGSVEAGAMAYSGVDFEPLGRLVIANGEPVVERYYERREVFGLHIENSFGPVALRAEAAFQPDRYFNTRTPVALAASPLDQYTAGLGLDIDGPWQTFINIQLLYDKVHDAPPTLIRPDEDRLVTVFASRSFSYESVRISARYYRSQQLNDEMVSLAVEFRLGDATEIRLAADSFSGNATGLLGQFSDKDRITLRLTHTF